MAQGLKLLSRADPLSLPSMTHEFHRRTSTLVCGPEELHHAPCRPLLSRYAEETQ
jgi:hypothetical protein